MTRRAVNCFKLLAAGLLLFSAPVWAQPGDPLQGEALFVGTVSFSQGGAPCLACHAIAGHELGYAAGASYGPDLTTLFDDYGEEGVAGVLEDLSFESMNAIYSERPLTEVERADLVAFFGTVSQGEEAHTGAALTLHAAIATALFMLLIGLLGWRRLQGVRKPLVEKARYGKGEIA
jgi:mono/diheme cytochrome c family protein